MTGFGRGGVQCCVVVLGALVLMGCRPAMEVPEVATTSLDRSLAERVEAARRAVHERRTSAEAWGAYGQALHAAEFEVEAAAAYRRAADLDPASARWHHLLGVVERTRDSEAALGHLARAAELAGVTPEAPRIRWAQALLERGRAGEARAALAVLTNAMPGHPAAHLELARIALADGQAEGVGALVGPCLTNPFTARPGCLILSQARARDGDIEGAAELARRAAALPRAYDWPDPWLREVLALRSDQARRAETVNALLAQRRLEDAGRAVRELADAAPDHPETPLLEGRLWLLQGRYREAEERFRASLVMDAGQLNARMQLALSLMGQERWNEAVRELEAIVKTKPDFAQAHANLGRARLRTGDAAGAVAAFREALRCDPGDASYQRLLEEAMRR